MINKLVKIGGALVNSRENFLKLIELIKSDEYENSFFVISGFGKTTQKLRNIAETALNSSNNALELLNELIVDLSKLSINECSFDDNILHLQRMIKGINITQELTPKLMDRIISYGEILSVKLIKSIIDNENIHFVDAENLIVTDSTFNNANPILELSKNKTLSYLSQNKFSKYITQGFIAADINGNRTTMGMESSNLTATLLADFLKLNELTIITDVDGIRNIDPKLSNNTKLIENLSYHDAMILANYGLKQIYPKMIEIAEKENIEIIFRSLYRNEESTKIFKNKSDNKKILIVKNLLEQQDDYDVLYHDNNFFIQFKHKEYDCSSSMHTQFILYNIDVKDTIKYILANLDFDSLWIDNYGTKVLKIISKINSVDELNKLINYINT